MTFKLDNIKSFEYLIERKSTTAGFEPTRANPFDFKSNALTTRPSCYILEFYKIWKDNLLIGPAHLLECKALNLVVMGSSPMVGMFSSMNV